MVRNLRIYKDIEPPSDGYKGKIIKYTDYYGRRKEFIKDILVERYSKVEFITVSFFDLRWNILYLLLLLFVRASNKYIVGDEESINVKYKLLCYIVLSIFDFICRLVLFIPYVLFVTFLCFIPIKRIKLSTESDIVFLRTNLVRNLSAGGSLGHIIGVIKGLVHNGVNVQYLGFDTSFDLDKRVEKSELSIGKFGLAIPVFSQMMIAIKTIISLSIRYRKSSVNTLVYYRPVSFDFTALFVSLLFRVPLVIEFNSFLAWEYKNNGGNSAIKRGAISYIEHLHLKRASKIVCVSEVLRRDLISAGYPQSIILVVPNGVDVDKFTPKLASDEIFRGLKIKDEIVVGFVGTFGPWHGIELLTETIKKLSFYGEMNVIFLLVGDGQRRMECQRKLNGFSNVLFTGKVNYEHIEDYLSVCDILLSPHSLQGHETEFIGSPTKLFEYMSMGKIVIGTKVGQLVEIVVPAINAKELSTQKSYNELATGILVDPYVEELTESLYKVITNIENLRYLGDNARLKAVQDYSWQARTKLMLDSFYK